MFSTGNRRRIQLSYNAFDVHILFLFENDFLRNENLFVDKLYPIYILFTRSNVPYVT